MINNAQIHEPIKVHTVWVGSPSIYKHKEGLPHTLDDFLKLQLLDLSIALYPELPQDIGGFLTFLESEIKYATSSTDEIELYFHCRDENVSYYQNIFNKFCQNITSNIKQKNIKTPHFKVIGFQETLTRISKIDSNLSLVLNAYHNFIHDVRVINVRDFMNYKDLMFYILLYLHGGYALDANVFVYDSKQAPQKNLKSFLKSPTSEFEPTIIKDDSGPRFCLHINPFTKFITFLRSTNHSQINTIRFFPLHDQFALRAKQNSELLLNIARFTLKNLIHFAEGLTHCKTLNFRDTNDLNSVSAETHEKILYLKTWYFLCGAVCAYLSPVFKHVQSFVASHSFCGSVDMTEQDNVLVGKHLSLFDGKANGILFHGLPLIKFQKNSHFVKKELIDFNVLVNVCDAINEHLFPVYQTANLLSSIRIDTEKIFTHQTRTFVAAMQ